MPFPDALKRYREEARMTQDDLADQMNKRYGLRLNRSTISRWENSLQEAGMSNVSLLADFFNVSMDAMNGKEHNYINLSGISPLPPTRLLPLLGMIQCGDPILAEENISDFIPVPDYIKADFCLTCKGDSMIGANIYDGDVVFIRKQPDVSSGEIAAVLIDDQATLKRVIKLPGGIILLQPENPKYQPIVLGGESETRSIRIIGKAVHYITRVK